MDHHTRYPIIHQPTKGIYGWSGVYIVHAPSMDLVLQTIEWMCRFSFEFYFFLVMYILGLVSIENKHGNGRTLYLFPLFFFLQNWTSKCIWLVNNYAWLDRRTALWDIDRNTDNEFGNECCINLWMSLIMMAHREILAWIHMIIWYRKDKYSTYIWNMNSGPESLELQDLLKNNIQTYSFK